MGCCAGKEEELPEDTTDAKVRSCTDVFMLIIFVLFWFLLVSISLNKDYQVLIYYTLPNKWKSTHYVPTFDKCLYIKLPLALPII